MAMAKLPTDAEQKNRAISRWDNEGGATGEAGEEYEAEPDKNKSAVELGRKGGAAQAKNMSPQRRAEMTQKPADKRRRR
jgi:hypothetical protein